MHELHSTLIDLTAVAELLALELDGRTIAPEDAERPSVAAIADHLAGQLRKLRDVTEADYAIP